MSGKKGFKKWLDQDAGSIPRLLEYMDALIKGSGQSSTKAKSPQFYQSEIETATDALRGALESFFQERNGGELTRELREKAGRMAEHFSLYGNADGRMEVFISKKQYEALKKRLQSDKTRKKSDIEESIKSLDDSLKSKTLVKGGANQDGYIRYVDCMADPTGRMTEKEYAEIHDKYLSDVRTIGGMNQVVIDSLIDKLNRVKQNKRKAETSTKRKKVSNQPEFDTRDRSWIAQYRNELSDWYGRLYNELDLKDGGSWLKGGQRLK